jgi:hypothetical protein
MITDIHAAKKKERKKKDEDFTKVKVSLVRDARLDY